MGLHATTKQTLTWLAAWPWLSSAQLAILLDQAGETVQRRLCRAVEQGEAQALVQFRPALPNETLYALTDAGIVQLARAVGVQPRALARRYDLSPQTSYAVLNDQDHVYRVRSLILGLVQLARQRGDQVTTGRTWPQVPFKRGSRNRTFGADAYVVYQHGTGCYPFFLLYDRDGQPLEVLRNQVGLYLRYRESGDYPGSYYHFPALVAILTDQDRLVELRLRALALGQRWNMLAPRLILTTRAELEGTGQQPGLAGPIWRAGQAYDAASGIRLLQALHEAPVAQYRFQIPTPSLKAPQRELGERDFRPVHVLGVPVSARLQDRQRLKDLYRAINDTKAKPAPGVAVWEEYVALLNAALTPATQAVLDLVSRFGYLSAAHIALVQGSSESWVRRYLLALKRQQIIVAWQPYHYPPLYCPTRPALYRLYRQRGWTARRALNRSQLYVGPGKDIPGQHLTHTLGVRDFFAQCYESARGAGDRLLDWRSEEECERRFVYHGETRSLRPDGYGRLYRHGKVWPFYLEWEHGSRHWQAGYREKLGSYHAYRFTQAPYAIEGHFPTILVVALTSEQSDWVCQAARQAAYEYEQPCLPVRVATKDDLHHQGLWGPIWRGPLTDDSRDKGLPFG